MGLAAGTPRVRRQPPHGQLREQASVRDRLPGHAAEFFRRDQAGVGSGWRSQEPGSRRRSARRLRHLRPGAAPGRQRAVRYLRGAGPAHRQQRLHFGQRDRDDTRRRAAGRCQQKRAAPRTIVDHHRQRAADRHADQVRQLFFVARLSGRRAAVAQQGHAGASQGRRLRGAAHGTGAVPGQFLAAGRRGNRRRRRAPARHPLQPVPPAAIGRPRRQDQHLGQGRDRRRLRRPLFLGHGNLYLPVFLVQQTGNRPQAAGVPLACLGQAGERARQMSHASGALYPWRTIAGEECSAYFPAGTAQYHINADIAYSIKLYFEATGDEDYLVRFGAEILMETARIWLGIGSYDREGRFCINQVTGPDEYTALVNNNYYTNAMARLHLNFAADVAERIAAKQPEQFARIAALMHLDQAEPAAWRRAAQLMNLPYDAALQIHAQDDSFLSKKVWDFANTPQEKYPLLLNYHPMVIYRHQVCKQADVVLALLLLSDEFTLEDKKRDFDYYEAVTTHDSSLSSCIYSIIASEIGYHEQAYDFFMETARLDLDNTHGNTHYGVHTAAMAGTWMGVAYGFAGMRVVKGALRFAPTLPTQWQHYTFKIHFQGALLEVRVEPGRTEYRLLQGETLRLSHRGEEIALTLSAPLLSRA